MTLQKLVWRAYKIAARTVAATKVVKLPLGNQTLGQRLGRLVLPILGSRLPNPIIAYGHRIYWESKSSYSFILETASESYEQETICLIQDLLRSDMTFVDLGAYIGLYSLLAANSVGQKGKVYAFEPEPSNCTLLQKNVSANGYEEIITTINQAVSNQEGSFTLYIGEMEKSQSSLYSSRWIGKQSLAVEVTTLDNFFAKKGWPPVHLIKMDIEGAEKPALEGMQQLMYRNPSLKLIVEFCPAIQVTVGVSISEFFDTLTKLGFQDIYAICDGLWPINVPDGYPRLLKMAGDGYVNLFCSTTKKNVSIR